MISDPWEVWSKNITAKAVLSQRFSRLIPWGGTKHFNEISLASPQSSQVTHNDQYDSYELFWSASSVGKVSTMTTWYGYEKIVVVVIKKINK